MNVLDAPAVVTLASPATSGPKATDEPSCPGLQVRHSAVHGKGVFAKRAFKAGEELIEYTGELITWDEALARHPHDPSQPNHTFYFHLSDHAVIDGAHGGNASRWINHGCEPNCEAEERGTQVFILALRDIAAGEELFFDYRLAIDLRHTPRLKREFACHCASPNCRGTLLAPKARRRRSAR